MPQCSYCLQVLAPGIVHRDVRLSDVVQLRGGCYMLVTRKAWQVQVTCGLPFGWSTW